MKKIIALPLAIAINLAGASYSFAESFSNCDQQGSQGCMPASYPSWSSAVAYVRGDRAVYKLSLIHI